MLTEYKGYSILVQYDKGAPAELCYVASINNGARGSEHTRGSSEKDAIEHLKAKIDGYDAFSSMYLQPLTEKDLSALKDYIKGNSRNIAMALKREHIIFLGRFASLTMAVIYNHYKLIEETLQAEGEDVSLDIAKLEKNNIVEKVALYSFDYYKNRRSELEDALRNF
ncbi:hypothetical protein [Oscillibacter sp.]|uniref:hypothetical protein n=1 Tax=Oscillibacter sp. TaxID=1945593 RepID=UPI00289EBCFF|nr:hypothetical protein [Oscillibacter sp.]